MKTISGSWLPDSAYSSFIRPLECISWGQGDRNTIYSLFSLIDFVLLLSQEIDSTRYVLQIHFKILCMERVLNFKHFQQSLFSQSFYSL
jgi:hypothetical protein